MERTVSLQFCQIFLSTPSARRATAPGRSGYNGDIISIHALREEGDVDETGHGLDVYISIHALREEGDEMQYHIYPRFLYFYPRPPRGGRLFGNTPLKNSFIFLSTPSARRATRGFPAR